MADGDFQMRLSSLSLDQKCNFVKTTQGQPQPLAFWPMGDKTHHHNFLPYEAEAEDLAELLAPGSIQDTPLGPSCPLGTRCQPVANLSGPVGACKT